MAGIGFFKGNIYDKVRSEYAQEVVEYIGQNFSQNNPPLSIVEVGAGTGKFTDAILKANLPIKEVYVVEPDNEGLKKHKEKYAGKTKFPILYKNAPSDKTELNDDYADIIFCGHCFHWFDFNNTRKEFLRIAKNTGQVFILGRFLAEDDIVSSRYIKMTRFGKRKENFTNNIEAYSAERMNAFYGHTVERKIICEESIPYSFLQMFGKLRVRINSSGYCWIRKKAFSVSKLFELLALFLHHRINGKLVLKYTTFAYCSNMI